MVSLRIAALLSCALAAAGAGPAAAQSADPGPAPGGRSDSALGARSEPDTQRSVIAPPGDVDPGMTRMPPPMASPGRVIQPPGTPGGNQQVAPK